MKIVISLGMLAYVLLIQVDLGQLWQVVLRARWGYLALAGALAIGGVALRAVRWLVLLQSLDIDVPLKRLVKLYFVGSFFNIFLLSGFGGDAIRIVELARDSKKAPEAAGTVLVDRATGLWTLFLMGLLALPFGFRDIPLNMALFVTAIALAAVIGGWIAMGTGFVPWLGSKIKLPGQVKLERFYQAVAGCGYAALGRACGISLLFNLLLIAVRFLIALGLNVHLPLGTFFLFAPLQSVALMVPSIGGLGVGEEVYRLMFGTVNVASDAAVAMSLMRYALQTVSPGLIGGILYAVDGAQGLRDRSQS
ncbi:MAG: flippase-like domain-containing protein [Anaerolineae bacterium]|nr:flippase-like domain-containing protein [Anaerolineae bacterium]